MVGVWRIARVGAAALLALCASCVVAAEDRERPGGEARGRAWGVYSATVGNDGRLSARAPDGSQAVRPWRFPVWEPSQGDRNPIEPAIEVTDAADGFDLTLRYANRTQRPGELGTVRIGGFDLGDAVTARDFRFDGKEVTLDSGGRGYRRGGADYPSGLYSPVAVLGGARGVIGVSIQYPILEYRHEVFVRVEANAAPKWGHAWGVLLGLNPGQADDVMRNSAEGRLMPGETREYVVSVRFAPTLAHWRETLEPYREFFARTYGGVRYQRDPRPVQVVSMAGDRDQKAGNPYGFRREELRPDRHGYGPLVDELAGELAEGWERFMIWGVSGLRENSKEYGLPFQFATEWALQPRMADAPQQFRRLAARGAEVGFWWGDSVRPWMDREGRRLEELDLRSAEHVRMAFDELDAAASAGATMIGLDAFRRMPVWEAHGWLRRLQERAPGVRFVVEPVMGDIMHTLAPAFLIAVRPSDQTNDLDLNEPHGLADLLVPGHESWALVRRDRLAQHLGAKPTEAAWRREMQRLASLGYVPVAGFGGEVGPSMLAE